MFKQIDTFAEPKIIGVNNGVYQIEIDEKSLKKNNNYAQIKKLIDTKNVFEFLKMQDHILKTKINYLRGNLLNNAKITDIMGFSPFIFGCKYIVSQNFVDCLIEELVDPQEFHLFKMNIRGLDLDYYLFFTPMIPDTNIIFSKSLIYPEKDLLSQTRNYFEINNYQEYQEINKKSLFNRWEKITLDKKFENNSIINIQSSSNLFFTDSLIERFKSKGITNFYTKDKIVLAFDET
jgi:hypothetical protein